MDLVDFFVVLGVDAPKTCGDELQPTVLTHYPEEEGTRILPPHLTMVRFTILWSIIF
jgi:hypothetical protein